MRSTRQPTRFLSIAAALLAITLSTPASAEEDLMDALRDGTIGNDFFVGDWCLVGSERDGDPAEPNLLYKFLKGGPLNHEKSDTGDKLHYGSWKLAGKMMMLRTTGGMYMVGIDSISQDEFSLGGKLDFTFHRGICDE